MWWNRIVLLLIFIKFCNAANSTDENTAKLSPDCKTIRKNLFLERRKCEAEFISYQIEKSNVGTRTESNRNCTNLDVIRDEFSRQLHNHSECFHTNISIIISKHNTRLEFLEKLQNDTKTQETLKEFFKNNGSECIKANGKIIQDKCLRQVIPHNETSSKDIRFSLYRATPFLSYGKRSCSKRSLIRKCMINVLKTQCLNSNAEDFVLSLDLMLPKCDSDSQIPKPPKNTSTPTTGIIVGVLLTLVALPILGIFAIKQIKKCANPKSESYEVSFHPEPKEPKSRKNNTENNE